MSLPQVLGHNLTLIPTVALIERAKFIKDLASHLVVLVWPSRAFTFSRYKR